MADDIKYIAAQIKELEAPSAQELNLLQHLVVQLRHCVPPQHEVENRAGSRPLTQAEVERFEEFAPIKRGAFSPAEDDLIVRNWKAFCKIHKWNKKNVQPFLLLRQSTSTAYIRSKIQRKKFVQFLADGLPNRTLFSVYHRFRVLYSKHSQGRYDEHEDEIILNHLENNPHLDEKRKYADLAKVLKRSRTSIWHRYKILIAKRQKAENS